LWSGTSAILTAEHVVGDIPEQQLRFFVRADAPLQKRKPDESHRPTAVTHRRSFDIQNVHRSTRHDLAAIELVQGFEPSPILEFFEIPMNPPTLDTESDLLYFGYAFDARMKTEMDAIGGTASAWTHIVNIDGDTALQNFDPTLQFLVDFEAFSQYNFEPGGLSGCGIWFQQANESKLWSADLALGGICTHYHRPHLALKFLRVEVVADFLRSRLPSPL